MIYTNADIMLVGVDTPQWRLFELVEDLGTYKLVNPINGLYKGEILTFHKDDLYEYCPKRFPSEGLNASNRTDKIAEAISFR